MHPYILKGETKTNSSCASWGKIILKNINKNSVGDPNSQGCEIDYDWILLKMELVLPTAF